MSNYKKLWNIWFIAYLVVINLYLTVIAIKDYLDFKYQMMDLAYGGNWNTTSIYLILGCLNISLALLPIIIYTSVVPQNNLANDGRILGKDTDVFHLTVNERCKGKIVPLLNKKSACLKNQTIQLIYMELPPISYLLNVISATCFLIPKAFMEGQRIHNGVLRSNFIWHSDLDFLFCPDQQHADFVHNGANNHITPMSVAYFNLGLSLVLLSLQYSRVLWHVSGLFTLLLSLTMVTWSVHVLMECCSVHVMIKVSLNPLVVSDQLRLPTNHYVILFLSVSSNLILLLSFTTVFHYALLQYADTIIHRNRRTRRQTINCSPQMVGSNQLDVIGTFSASVSENNYSESSIDPVFSKSHVSHIVAIVCICTSTSLKSSNVYLSFVHLYQTTSDSLILTNVLISCLYVVLWLILWFALALRRNWNFKIPSDTKFNGEALFLNGSTANNPAAMSLHQIHNSMLRNAKTSDITLSKQALNRGNGLDGCSDDTDMSSSNNYVFLQSMRNGQLNLLESGGQPAVLRNQFYLAHGLNNTIYANDDLINNRSIQLEDQLGSEHSYNSNRSRNTAFENLPPILPNFDESRYRNSNSVAMDKLIPRYLRNQSLDYNNFMHFSMPQQSSGEFTLPTVTSPTMPYCYDNGTNVPRYKQSGPSSLATRPLDKYSTLQTSGRSSTLDGSETFIIHNSDDDLQRRSLYVADFEQRPMKGVFDQRRVVMSPVMFPTLEESVTESLLPRSDDQGTQNDLEDGPDEPTNDQEESMTVADRMCSQV